MTFPVYLFFFPGQIIPQDAYDQYAMKVAEAQSKLAASGKDFVYILTPQKLEVYPEKLPGNIRLIADSYAADEGTTRDMLLKAFDISMA